MLDVEIDSNSGFCAGVVRAIGKAEDFLSGGGRLYSLGAIVHNEAELARLAGKGLVTLDTDDMDRIPAAPGETLLIRAHGQPPKVYDKLASLGFKIIDCTCPVVLKIQKSILGAAGSQIVIFGKIGHAEVLGLIGQVDEKAMVVENLSQLQSHIADGSLDLGRDTHIFSQTTMSPTAYKEVCEYLSERMSAELIIHNTICSQVASRHKLLSEFASGHDVIVFVAGRTSSNGKVLCDLCRSVNPRTYQISALDELRGDWFRDGDKVGVCGATSTPRWLLEQTAEKIKHIV